MSNETENYPPFEAAKKNPQTYPSIFNDVIGPVMRGPSSSHCAAGLRIGKIARDLMGGAIQEVFISFDPDGSLATTHESQGSDMGLCGGFLGWEATDERLPHSMSALQAAGIQVHFLIESYGATHPNTYKMLLKNAVETHTLTAISTGGGMVEILEIDGFKLSMLGDYYETLIYLNGDAPDLFSLLKENLHVDEVYLLSGPAGQMIEVKAQSFINEQTLQEMPLKPGCKQIKHIFPVLPVLSHAGTEVPFITIEEMFAYNLDKNLQLWELAVHYESARGNMPHDQVLKKMAEIVQIMQHSIQEGIKGTQYADRILAYQSGAFLQRMEEHRLLDGGMLNQIILYVTAMMETKSSMGVIVAAPTAGSCSGLPGACIGAAYSMGLPLEKMTEAMLAAGLIGVFIAAHATFAAEVGGCQAECGAGSGMAAAALVTLAKGNLNQSLNAVSMALQNILGMICDPVANRVEVPCLGKNVMAASNALACANMALADYDAVIPLDEVIETMHQVGKSIPVELRCTALGGLSITKTSREITKRLERSKAG